MQAVRENRYIILTKDFERLIKRLSRRTILNMISTSELSEVVTALLSSSLAVIVLVALSYYSM